MQKTSERIFLGAAKITKPVSGIAFSKLWMANAIAVLQNFILALFRKILYKSIRNPENILLYRTGSLGDSLCAIPAIKAIGQQFPDARIDILTNAGKSNLVGMRQLLDKSFYNELIDYYGSPKVELLRQLKKKQYDLVVQLPQVDASFLHLLRDLIVFRTIAPFGFGWHRSQSRWFRKTQARHLQFYNESTRLLLLLQQQGIQSPDEAVHLQPVQEDIETALRVLHELGIREGDKIIAIVVGAKRPQNRWPIAHFKRVIEAFSPTFKMLLIGSREDGELVQPLLINDAVKNACGLLTPMQSAAALQVCALTLSNDTGPMHLSYAVGTPTIALFSSRDLPGKWFPPENDKNHVFRTPGVACEACFSEVCNNNICMQAIMPNEVILYMEQFFIGIKKELINNV
jgi:ADP-heptose:LPS heptosyltransferase